MKTRAFFTATFLAAAAAVQGQTPAPEAPVPVMTAPPTQPQSVGPQTENQRLYSPSQSTLVSREAAENVIQKFHSKFAASEAPRVVIYVNRELVDFDAGLKLTRHTEHYDETETHTNGAPTPPPASAPASENNGGTAAASAPSAGAPDGSVSSTRRTSGENTYTVDHQPKPTLADRQTVRDVERLFGRVFRNAGARLADQRVAATVLKDEPGRRLVGEQAARERAALGKVADIAVEVLISSRNLTVPGIASEQVYTVPDIQATAIRLSDAAIVGQASASDILGRDQEAARLLRQFDVNDITEAVALALLEDMTTGQ